MSSAQADSFVDRLKSELAALSWKERSELLVRIGQAEIRMRGDGQERPVWKGPLPEDRLLGADVVIPTDQGERRGRVICYGVVNTGPEYERSVVVHVPSSGTHHEAPGSRARLADAGDIARMDTEVEMAQRLEEAVARPKPAARDDRPKKRGQKDPELTARMLAAARASANVMAVEEGGSNYKIVGVDPDRRLYLFKGQLRVDVSGFSFDHPGLRRISDEEAREMHLGRVRGQVLFNDRDEAIGAFEMALGHLAG